jgi:hypothetical protein
VIGVSVDARFVADLQNREWVLRRASGVADLGLSIGVKVGALSGGEHRLMHADLCIVRRILVTIAGAD